MQNFASKGLSLLLVLLLAVVSAPMCKPQV
jgi:hypothetical protein